MAKETIDAVCDRVGGRLALHYGSLPIPIHEIAAEVVAELACNPKSIITDRCYNRNNAGIDPNTPRMFEYLGEGEVRYLGLDNPYNGPMMHKPKGEAERVVGHWTNGELTYTG